LHIDTGNISLDDMTYMKTYYSGQLAPDFTLIPSSYKEASKIVIGKYAWTVAKPTTLDEIIHADEGGVDFSACESVYTPAGAPLEAALASLPIRTPGSRTVSWLPSDEVVTLQSGVLHISNTPQA
jgi:hypothetical protein